MARPDERRGFVRPGDGRDSSEGRQEKIMSVVMAWVVSGLLLASMLLSIMSVGKPRKPMTAGQAAFVALMDVVLIALVLYSVYGG